MPTYDDILLNYESIYQSVQEVRNYLASQLFNCFITDLDEDITFTELIEKVGEIDAVEVHNRNNIKPLDMPEIDFTNYTTYNETLYARIRYYMRRLAYYLVLKGVPTGKVAAQSNLAELISLISLIKVRLPTTMTIADPEEEYYFGPNIALDYQIKDIKGNDITNGEITIEADGILYDTISVGRTLSFAPLRVSEKVNGEYQPITFTFTYIGSDEYSASESVTKDIVVMPSKATVNIFVNDISPESRYYTNSHTGYIDDNWSIQVRTYNYQGQVLPNIPFTLWFDSGELYYGVTDNNGNSYFNETFNQVGNHTITCETTYRNTDLITNTSSTYDITLYYSPLYQPQKKYYDYAGKTEYEYELIIRDINTGELYSNIYDSQTVSAYINDNFIGNIKIENGKAIASISNQSPLKITTGEYTLRWVLNSDQRKTNIEMLSNFILPKKDKFFLTDTPEIYYAPLYSEYYNTSSWSPIADKQVSARIIGYDTYGEKAIDDDIILHTNSDGVLYELNNYKDCYSYVLKLKTESDNLDEEIDSYKYEIAEPFQIVFLDYLYDRKVQAQYDVYVFDKEDYNSYIDCINFNKDILNLCTISTEEYDEYYKLRIFIPAQTETYGHNTLTFTLNNYEQSSNFLLLESNLELLTTTATVGNGDIQLQDYGDVEITNIESDTIIVNEITKDGDIFTVNADFLQAGINNFTIYTEDDIETFYITVDKGDINCNIIIEKIIPNGQTQIEIIDDGAGHYVEQEVTSDIVEEIHTCPYNEVQYVNVSISIDVPENNDIEAIYTLKDNNTVYSNITNTYTYINNTRSFQLPDIKPGYYTVACEYFAPNNGNYNSFIKTSNFIVEKNISTLQIEEKYPAYRYEV